VLVWEFIIAFFSCERGFEECNAIFMWVVDHCRKIKQNYTHFLNNFLLSNILNKVIKKVRKFWKGGKNCFSSFQKSFRNSPQLFSNKVFKFWRTFWKKCFEKNCKKFLNTFLKSVGKILKRAFIVF
jgi:hypothetical protein